MKFEHLGVKRQKRTRYPGGGSECDRRETALQGAFAEGVIQKWGARTHWAGGDPALITVLKTKMGSPSTLIFFSAN